jgi:hypothetical protein
MKYSRPIYEECDRLAAEYSARYQDYLDAQDTLALTAKDDPSYVQKRKHLDKIRGQLAEAGKREDFHESTHQD